MAVAEEIWDSKKLLDKWGTILKENPTVINLWTKYIDFRQTDFLSFTYPECIKCFAGCFSILKSTAFERNIQSQDREALEGVIIYVFTRVIVLMDESGYKENAIAALQAMLELNLLTPTNKHPPSSKHEFLNILEKLEMFWDSEVERIGEDGALGWAAFVRGGENLDAGTQNPEQDVFEIPELDASDPFGSWTDTEIKWSQTVGMPARTTEETGEDDPYRVILFSDLKDFMFYFTSECARRKVIDSFLILKSMPPLAPYPPM